MKAAVRPILDLRNVSMLDRVVMNIIDVTGQIVVIANSMLPIAPLPDAFVAFFNLASGTHVWTGKATRKFSFDDSPTQREIQIGCRQGPDRMQMAMVSK